MGIFKWQVINGSLHICSIMVSFKVFFYSQGTKIFKKGATAESKVLQYSLL